MLTDVQICNMALSEIGEKSIAALTEASENGRRCNQFYDHARKMVLAAHNWGFAKVRATLVEVSGETAEGWDYLYLYPPKCLMVRKVFNVTTIIDPRLQKHEIMLSPVTLQRAIATDDEDAYVEYTADVSDTTMFSVVFVQALVFTLASLLAPKLTGSDQKALTLLQMADREISRATANDAQENRNPPDAQSTYLDAR